MELDGVWLKNCIEAGTSWCMRVRINSDLEGVVY